MTAVGYFCLRQVYSFLILGYGSQILPSCLIRTRTVTSVNDNSYRTSITPGQQ